MRVLTAADTSSELLTELHRLVVDAFQGDFSREDWEHTEGGWRVVALDGDAPLSHAAVVPRLLHIGDRELRTGYVEGVATAPARRGEGLAALVMSAVSDLVRDKFEIGALSTSLPGFYERLGWERWRGPTFVRTATEVIRTPLEDDGVMVLRFGSSRGIDLGAPISCTARAGDDW